jgi:4-amino-4-deoxy-L-arabinose transferase-like glycosyltransferase
MAEPTRTAGARDEPSPAQDDRIARRALVGIVALAVVLRVIGAFALPDQLLWPDESGYYNVALNLHDGNGYTNEQHPRARFPQNRTWISSADALSFAPGLPTLLAGVMSIVGEDLTSLRVMLGLVQSTLPLLVYACGLLLLGSRRAAVAAALVAAVYPYYVYLSNVFLVQGILTVLLALVITMYLYWRRVDRLVVAGLVGVTAGVASLFSVPMLFASVPIGAFILWRALRRHAHWASPLLFALGLAAPTVPWIAHASSAHGSFVLITKTGSPLAFVQCNHEALSAGEVLSHTPGPASREVFERLKRRVNADADPADAAAREVHKILYEQPLHFARNCLLRVAAFFSPVTYTMASNDHKGGLTQIIGIFVWLPFLLLSLPGLLRALLDRRGVALQLMICLGMYMAPYVALVSNTRYRLPWDFVFIILSMYAMVTYAPRLSERVLRLLRLLPRATAPDPTR